MRKNFPNNIDHGTILQYENKDSEETRDKIADIFAKSWYKKMECRHIKNDEGQDATICVYEY
jgi:hypothetical protein